MDSFDSSNQSSSATIVSGDLRTFFGERLQSAAKNQRLHISPFALNYVTEVLVAFHATARLFQQEGVKVPVMADMLLEAMEADLHRKIRLLQQMGDTSLMVSGFFPEALTRRSLDLEYYQKMGEIAYSNVGSLIDDWSVFDELSERFFNLSSLINEVAEETQTGDMSLLKLLEFYMSTGSDRVFEKLKRQGIIPFPRRKTKA